MAEFELLSFDKLIKRLTLRLNLVLRPVRKGRYDLMADWYCLANALVDWGDAISVSWSVLDKTPKCARYN